MMKNVKANILLCEDDTNLATIMVDYLRSNNYTVDLAINGQQGLENLQNQTYDLCLISVMMPEVNGLEMVKTMRETGNNTPVILISQRGEREDIIAGYEAGCDDYVVKPFSMDIVICKINAFLKRLQLNEENSETVFQIGSTTYDSTKQLIGNSHLSTRENDVLLLLCRKRNHVVPRSQILKAVWQNDNYFATRSLAVYINHLRHRLDAVPQARIVAAHGKGYKLIIDD